MRDAPILTQVIELAQRYDWLVMHQRPSMKANGQWVTAVAGNVGYPDLTMIHYRRADLLIVEVKSERSKLTDAQEAWLTAFRQAGCDAQVWRPMNLEYAQWRLGPTGLPSSWFDIAVDVAPHGHIIYNTESRK